MDLYNTSKKEDRSLYLNKHLSQNYISKFISYDKHTIKEKAFFYFKLSCLKNLNSNRLINKFLPFKNLKTTTTNSKNINQNLNKKFIVCNPAPEIKNYTCEKTYKHLAYVIKGNSAHGDNIYAYLDKVNRS